VKAVVPATIPGGQGYTILVTATNTGGVALQGMEAFVRVDSVASVAVAVPKLCVLNADYAPQVFTVANGRVTLHPVNIGVTDLDFDQITSGVSAGQQCVAVGNQTLVNGQRVRVTGTIS
jgi:hypothetical protein